MNPDQRGYRTFQALVLGALGIFLLARIGDGGILRYINQRSLLLVLGAALGLLLLAQVLLQARGPAGAVEKHEHPGEVDGSTAGREPVDEAKGRGWGLWLLALPLMIGLLLPQRTLGYSAALLRGLGTIGAPRTSALNGLSVPPEQRDVLEWIRALETSLDPAALAGQPADVVGFVYRDGRTPAGHFYAARFSILCCAADASAFGVDVAWPDAASLADGDWVRVRGPVEILISGDAPRLLLRAESVEKAPEPAQPYLFP
jgi:putative membrane protein